MSAGHAKYEESVAVGVVLAGGAGQRIGRDKRFLTLEGATLLQRSVAFLRTLFPTVAVSVGTGQELDLGDITGVELLPDAWPGASPLAGIATALQRFRAPVFALGVDLAFPNVRAARRVLAAARTADVAIPAIGDMREPLFAAYRPRCLDPIVAELQRDRHRIVGFFPAVTVAEVRFRNTAPFFNINTMAQFAEARRLVAAGAGTRIARRPQPALVAIVGKSDSGKTTLIESLLPELGDLGLRVGTVKHDAHDFEIDHPGKDSWRHGRAGAKAYVVAAPQRIAYVGQLAEELPLDAIARRFFADFDLVVAEGYKRQAPFKIEIFRAGAGHAAPLCAPGEALALVTDADVAHEHRFAPDHARGLAEFIAARLDTLRRY
jgi:molybdopterin-guanine dinucleotide biosynthesis protein